jgi:hypothetical protein
MSHDCVILIDTSRRGRYDVTPLSAGARQQRRRRPNGEGANQDQDQIAVGDNLDILLWPSYSGFAESRIGWRTS